MTSRRSDPWGVSRRGFLQSVGVGATLASLRGPSRVDSTAFAGELGLGAAKRKAVVKGAFLYPPTAQLEEEGYFSWPGSTFQAEKRHQEYLQRFKDLENKIGITLDCETTPISTSDQIQEFVNTVRETKPDAVLPVVFKKTVWQEHGVKMLEALGLPAIVLAPLGVLLAPSVGELEKRAGVYTICAENPADELEDPLRMVRTAVELAESLIVNIQGDSAKESVVAGMGAKVRTIPRQRFIAAFEQVGESDDVKALARDYLERAVEIVEPTERDILEAARAYFALKQIVREEQADAVMMECLPGLKKPHQHVPPCMGFMSLRDEGVPAGCESDLDATLTLMLLQSLFGKPGFQHNPGVDNERNHYFCAHCTSASRMRGIHHDPERIALRSHAEAGWGCVPRVLFSEDQEVTISKYLAGEAPKLLLYSGKILRCPPIPPTGGCRTNAETTINELEKVSDLKGHHLCMIYGNHTSELKRFCRLYGIEVVI
ncbi:MAG: hypothetical protein GHCLOJNM_01233 [bacterium]|nr:hypothetical protein [bacterium]